jgi:hypothetical protein
VIRQSHFIAVVGAFLIAAVVVGCAQGNIDERGGEGEADAANEETTEPAGLDAEVVSPLGEANMPAGFGEGSLWATGFKPSCDDVIGDSASASASASSGASLAGGCVLPAKTHLKRVDPRTGEVIAEIPLEWVGDSPELAVGAGSVWISPGEFSDPTGDLVLRVDPRTKRVVDRIPVDSPTGLDFGFGSVWVTRKVTSAGYGTLSRIDPQTGEVVAKIDVDRGAVDVAVDESSEAVWVAGQGYNKPENNKLSRVDPETNRVVAEIPIRADARDGGADNVAVGEGEVWVSSADKLLKVNPETNEVAGMVSVGADDGPRALVSHVAVYGGGVWAMGQAWIRREHPKPGRSKWMPAFRLVRVDPSTMHVVASEYLTPFYNVAPGALAAGGGYVWFSSGKGLARVAP